MPLWAYAKTDNKYLNAMKNNFWNEASRCGAVLGLVSVAFAVAGIYVPTTAAMLALILSGLNFVITIYLLFYYTRRRATQFTKEGYSYVQCMGFIVASGLFAGIITGAYQIVASNFFFVEQYKEMYNTILATYAQMKVFDNEQLEMAMTMLQSLPSVKQTSSTTQHSTRSKPHGTTVKHIGCSTTI